MAELGQQACGMLQGRRRINGALFRQLRRRQDWLAVCLGIIMASAACGLRTRHNTTRTRSHLLVLDIAHVQYFVEVPLISEMPSQRSHDCTWAYKRRHGLGPRPG
jgi:hypothetical protein